MNKLIQNQQNALKPLFFSGTLLLSMIPFGPFSVGRSSAGTESLMNLCSMSLLVSSIICSMFKYYYLFPLWSLDLLIVLLSDLSLMFELCLPFSFLSALDSFCLSVFNAGLSRPNFWLPKNVGEKSAGRFSRHIDSYLANDLRPGTCYCAP